jgi:hypothetical protein
LTDIRAAALCVLLSAGLVSSCSKPAEQPAPSQAAGASQPAEAAGAPGQQAPIVTGPVLETMNAANYTYVRVKTDAGDVWAASSEFKVAVGDRISLALEMPMENFHSQSLNRDFPVIYFTTRIGPEGAVPASASAPAMMAGHAQTGAADVRASASAAQVTEPIQPAPGGTTVANLWANRKSLAGKTVTVRGKVVKFNGGIMGRNWIHIQDGTGSAGDGTHDLLVTTDASANVGDVITATGTVAIDKDFTAGYAYAVLIEGAKIEVK